jgi:hypothetical protein
MRSRELPADVDPTSVLRASAGTPIHISGGSPFYPPPNGSELANPANVDLSTLGQYDQPYINSITASATVNYQMRSTQVHPRPSNINLLAMPAYGLAQNRPQDSPMQPSFPAGNGSVAFDPALIHHSPSPGNVQQGTMHAHPLMNNSRNTYLASGAQSQFAEGASSFPVEVSRQNHPVQATQTPSIHFTNAGGVNMPQNCTSPIS